VNDPILPLIVQEVWRDTSMRAHRLHGYIVQASLHTFAYDFALAPDSHYFVCYDDPRTERKVKVFP
jgi:hypothetical protein